MGIIYALWRGWSSTTLTRDNGHKLQHRRFPLNIRKHFCYCEDDQARAQAAQGGCGISTHGDIQKPSGHGPGQLAQGGPAWAEGLDQMTSRGPFQPQPFCDSDYSRVLGATLLVSIPNLHQSLMLRLQDVFLLIQFTSYFTSMKSRCSICQHQSFKPQKLLFPLTRLFL